MRDNGSVTQREHHLPANSIIISHTDLHGTITNANDDFVDASGYHLGELIGQPHNILRHPDVPAIVFKDLWDTLKAGKPWSQIVKNRCKNGDHYWVQANATPIFENGSIVGYMSQRFPATEEEKRLATQAYKQIAAGRMAIKNGVIQNSETRFNPLRHFNTESVVILLAALTLISTFITNFVPGFFEIVPQSLFATFNLLMVASVIFVMLHHKGKLGSIDRLMQSIASGKFNNKIDTFGNNQVQRILGRIQSMQVKLGSDLNDSNEQLIKAIRLEEALKSSSTNIMVADRFHKIIFINDALMAMLRTAEPELKKYLPQFDVNNLINQSSEIFHKNPQHQIGILDNLTQPYKSRITIGRIIIDLTVSPVINDKGERLGSIAEWQNMTDKVAIENKIGDLISEASQGELSQRIDTSGLQEFELTVSESMNSLLTNFSQSLGDVTQVLAAMSQGDLTKRMDGDFLGQLESIKLAINNSLTNLEITLGNVKAGAEEIGTMSREVATASEDLSERTQQQAASLEETAASMEQITSSTKHTADNMRSADEISHQTASSAQQGIEVMQQTIQSMHGITELSKKIGEITSVIDSIAFQTNLLALNAAVEAARAGEHGRGFAVVAGEVRSLAQKSAEAAKDISNLISSATAQIETGTTHVENTNSVFNDMVDKINHLATLISEASQTTSEQAKGIEQINQAMAHLDQATQQNAALVEELSATATNMSDQAHDQATFISRFTLHNNNRPRTALSARFTEAKMAHNTLIIRLDSYLSGANNDIDENSVTVDNLCEIGKWIYSDGQNLMHLPQMQRLQQVHKTFHNTVKEALDATHANELDTAHKLKNRLLELSQEVSDSLDQLENEIAIRGLETLSSHETREAPVASKASSPVAPPKPAQISAPALKTPSPTPSNSDDDWDEF